MKMTPELKWFDVNDPADWNRFRWVLARRFLLTGLYDGLAEARRNWRRSVIEFVAIFVAYFSIASFFQPGFVGAMVIGACIGLAPSIFKMMTGQRVGPEEQRKKLSGEMWLLTQWRLEGDRRLVALRPMALVREIKALAREAIDGRKAQEQRVEVPPAFAEVLLAALANPRKADALVGDLSEQFRSNVHRYGPARARRLYWVQVGRSTGPQVKQRIARFGKHVFLAIFWSRW